MVRSYFELLARLRRAAERRPGVLWSELGTIPGPRGPYPIVALVSQNASPRSRTVCLAAGIHGDEPAGVEAVAVLLEEDRLSRWLDRLRFLILPCINPFGYEHHTRANGKEIDLNRQFRRRDAPREVRLVRRAMGRARFDLEIELHEDVDTAGFYLYELARRPPLLGETIVRAARRFGPINLDPEIEGMPSRGGIIRVERERVARRRDRWPQAIYAFRRGTLHCLTIETPVHLKLRQRARVHIAAVETALRTLFDQQPTVRRGAGSRASSPATPPLPG